MTFTHTVAAATLSPSLGGGRGTAAADQLAEVERLLEVAEGLLTDACEVTFRTIPAAVCDELVIKVVRALWDARKTAHGAQYTDNGAEAGPRAPRDPLAVVEPILARYVVPL